jgi:hypothetical protein
VKDGVSFTFFISHLPSQPLSDQSDRDQERETSLATSASRAKSTDQLPSWE